MRHPWNGEAWWWKKTTTLHDHGQAFPIPRSTYNGRSDTLNPARIAGRCTDTRPHPRVRAASSTRAQEMESSPSLSITGCSTSSRILLEVARQPHQMPQSLSGILHTWATSYPWKCLLAIALLYHANAALPFSPLIYRCHLLLTPPPRTVSHFIFLPRLPLTISLTPPSSAMMIVKMKKRP